MPKFKGNDLLLGALESVTSQVDDAEADENLDKLARRSAVVIDSANLNPALLGERSGEFDVTVAEHASSFTWGTDGDIPGPPPAEIDYWGILIGGNIHEMTPRGALTPLSEWRLRANLSAGGYPRMLYWRRDVDGGGRHVLRFAPAADQEYTFRLHAQIPALTRISRSAEYDLPQGVAAYLQAIIALDACTGLGVAQRPEHAAAVRSARRALMRVDAPVRRRITDPSWLNLSGRGAPRWRGGI